MKNFEGKGLITLLCGIAVAAVIAVSAPAWLDAAGGGKDTASANIMLDEDMATASFNKLFQDGLLLPGVTGPVTKLLPKNDPDKYGVRTLLILRGLGFDYVQDIIKYGGLWFIEEDGRFAIHPMYYAVDENGEFSVWITKAILAEVNADNCKEVLDLSGVTLIKSGEIDQPPEETETETEEKKKESETEKESESEKEKDKEKDKDKDKEKETEKESETPTVSQNSAKEGSAKEGSTTGESKSAETSPAAAESESASK